ncbi:MAG: ABC transporter ATP-binding protein, partial [Acidimicrobiia bacterium]
MATVSFQHVKKIYADGTVAVVDLSLEIPDGELMVFVGPSGCGKTTALRMVAGLEEITDGEIRIGDEVVNRLPPRDRDIAMVFQNYALYPHKTVFENLAFPLKLRRLGSAEIKERVARIASILELN